MSGRTIRASTPRASGTLRPNRWPIVPLVCAVLVVVFANDVYRLLAWFSTHDGTLNQPLATSVTAGLLALLVAWLLSTWFTGELSPLAIARRPLPGDVQAGAQPTDASASNAALSLSKLQTLLYFLIVIVGYVMVVAYRAAAGGLTAPLPAVPLTVLSLLGLAVGTSLGTQALSLRYQQENRVPNTDRSDLIRGREGAADLTKLQMLLWTAVGIGTYGLTMLHFLHDGCYVLSPGAGSVSEVCRAAWTDADLPQRVPTLPSFDPLLLVLAGVVQGTFFAGRVLQGRVLPRIDGVYRTAGPGGTRSDLRVLGTFPGIVPVGTQSAPTATPNVQIEISVPGGAAELIDLRDPKTVDPAKAVDTLDGTVQDFTYAAADQIKLRNAVGAGTFQFRVGIDGVWSDPTSATI